MKKTKVLIVGGSGYIGQEFTKLLLHKGYEVAWLCRKKHLLNIVSQFTWNYYSNKIDLACFDNVDVVVNFSGKNINTRWTKKNRKQIRESRIDSTKFLIKTINENQINLSAFIQFSAIGYYGLQNKTESFVEEANHGNDFLAQLCFDWENEPKQLNRSAVRKVVFRLGVVFNKGSLAYDNYFFPFKFGLNFLFDNGNQNLNWVDINDVCRAILFAIENKNLNGVYNLCAQNGFTYKQLSEMYCRKFSRKIFKIFIPKFIMKLMFGKLSQVYLSNINVSNKKIIESGFSFQHHIPRLE